MSRSLLGLAAWAMVAGALSACGPNSPAFDAGPRDGATLDAVLSDGGTDGSADAVPEGGDDASADVAVEDATPSDARPAVTVYVYAHTESELYRVHPLTFETRLVAAFRWPSDGADHRMTDIAITADDQIWGVTFDTLYRVDAATAACTRVAALAGGHMFNGLSFIPATAGAAERLLATTREGAVYQVNVTTGATSMIGSYGGIYGSSGDLVSVQGAGTFATVVDDNTFFPTEFLARIDETTGAATIIGPTGVSATWGLGYWGGTLYGFSNGGQMVTIDVSTGHATAVAFATPLWYGAGVSTHAPITHL